MAKIFVFRHGQSTDNRDRIFSGKRDVDLSPQGIKEAESVGEELQKENATKAYSSTQTRSIHTLNLVLNGFHPNVQIFEDERLRERDYGDLTGKNKDQVEDANKEKFKLWHRSYETPPPKGESIKDVEERVLNFLREMIPTWEEKDVIFLSVHGNSLRPIRKHFEGLSVEDMCLFEHEPGKIYSYLI